MMKLLSTRVAVGVLTCAVIAGCSRNRSSPDTPAGHPGTIAISHDPAFTHLAESITAEAVKRGFDVVPLGDDTHAIALPLDALVLIPRGRKLTAAGFPVFTVDLDHRNGGRLAADAFSKGLDEEGRIAILDDPAADSSTPRILGFQERLAELNAESGVDIRVVAQLPGGGNKARSLSATQIMLQAQGSLNGILALNTTDALGAREALEATGKKAAIDLVVFSENPDEESATAIVPVFDDVASNTVGTISRFLAGESSATEILVPMKSVRGGSLP